MLAIPYSHREENGGDKGFDGDKALSVVNQGLISLLLYSSLMVFTDPWNTGIRSQLRLGVFLEEVVEESSKLVASFQYKQSQPTSVGMGSGKSGEPKIFLTPSITKLAHKSEFGRTPCFLMVSKITWGRFFVTILPCLTLRQPMDSQLCLGQCLNI